MEPKDFLQHQTKTKPKFKDRIKILLGGTLVVDSEIATQELVTPLWSHAVDRVEPPKYLRWLWSE
jgi:hypothetical protein